MKYDIYFEEAKKKTDEMIEEAVRTVEVLDI